MRFLVDQNLSPRVAELLVAAGHEATHTAMLGMDRATDAQIIEHARTAGLVVLTADADFGTLLAMTHAEAPSVLYVRRTHGRRADAIAAVVLENLHQLTDALDAGSLVVLGEGTARIRALPIL